MIIGFTYYHTRNSKLKNWVLSQRVNSEVLQAATAEKIAGYTLIRGIGVWEGKTEPTLQLQLEGISVSKAVKLAKTLKQKFNQDSVMLKTDKQVRFI